MSESREWRAVTEFGAGYEADVAEAVLDAAEIPVLRKGDEAGIFGPGFSGPSTGGITLFVPAERLGEAREALSLPEE